MSKEIFELLEIGEDTKVTLEYLVKISKKFEILEAVRENIFQFNPSFDEKGRSQTFSDFYISCLIGEIIYYLLLESSFHNRKLMEREGIKKRKKGEKTFLMEDFALFHFDVFLDNKDKNDYCLISFVLNNNLDEIKKEDIINLFMIKNDKLLDSYFD